MEARTKLKRHGPLYVTPDLITPLNMLLEKVKTFDNLKLSFQKPELDPLLSGEYSMLETGREVRLIVKDEDLTLEEELGLMWALAIPLKFTPIERYPIPGPRQSVFHFLGPWALLYERLLAEGRGELSWPSVCIAAQCDVGAWKGDKPVERNVQAQLHRVGINCGPIDGIIGPRTVTGLKAARLSNISLETAEKELREQPSAVLKMNKKNVYGHLVIQNTEYSVNTFGRITSTRVNNGTAFVVQGPGRIVVDVE